MKKIFIAFALLAAVLLPNIAKADGGIVVPPYRWIHETDQKAVIVSENGVETLILSTSFRGDVKDFAWIVPTPSKPEVTKGAVKIFDSLASYTNVSTGGGIVYDSMPLSLNKESSAPAVDVIEEKKVGIYSITVLEANDKNALYNWLKEKGYNYPEYGKSVLDDYIQNGWFFTTVKINPEDLVIVKEDLVNGTITPLKLVFSTDKVVYPLKISSITMEEKTVQPASSSVEGSASGSVAKEIVAVPTPTTIIPNNYMGVKIYVFADHKKQAEGFETQYAGWVDSKTIKDFALDDNGNSWYSPKGDKMYLTALYRSMSTRDMKADLFLTNAPDNSQYPPSHFWEYLAATLLLILVIAISPFGLFFVIFMLLYIFLKSRPIKMIMVVLQILLALFGIIVAVAMIFADGFYSDSLPIILAVAITTVASIVGIVFEIVLKKKKAS